MARRDLRRPPKNQKRAKPKTARRAMKKTRRAKLCNGHLKRYYDYPKEVAALIGAKAEILPLRVSARRSIARIRLNKAAELYFAELELSLFQQTRPAVQQNEWIYDWNAATPAGRFLRARAC